MNLAIDIGNTAVKWATFEGHTLLENGLWSAETRDWRTAAIDWGTVEHAMVCASGDASTIEQDIPPLTSHVPRLTSHLSRLTSQSPLPIRLDYKTPDTLGPDRIAAACGAQALHPGEDCLVIDAGTCVTVDFLDRHGIYHGGAILPGLDMNLRALHTFTDKLPLIDITAGRTAPVLGRSTEECIVAGTLGALQMALAGYIALYRQKCPDVRVLVTGGDATRLMPTGANGSEHLPLLTLIGLNEIMSNHEE